MCCDYFDSHRLLVDGDAAPRLVLGRLGHRDAQDAVVQRGPDRLVVDTAREVEGPREGADVALDQIVLVAGPLLLLLGRGRWLDRLGHGRGRRVLGSRVG